MTNTIITIGRQFGSGGREIGRKVARALEIPYYDRELLAEAAKESGLCEELFETHDEKPTNSFLYSLVMDSYALNYGSGYFNEMPINHKVFLAQFDTIKKIASKGPCVMIGRCADYALEDLNNCLNVFIYADMDARIRRIASSRDLSDAKAKEVILKNDKARASYYNYYTTKKWGQPASYDICLNSTKIGIDQTVQAILHYVELFEAQISQAHK